MRGVNTLIFDTHANVLNHIVEKIRIGKSGIIDSYHIPQQLEGNVTGGIWIYSPDSKQISTQKFNKEVAYILEELKQSENIQIVMSKDHWDDQSVNVVLGLKGLANISEIQNLEQIYQLGFRHGILSNDKGEKNNFIWNNEKMGKNIYLTDMGVEAIKKMNELGMVIDISKEKEQIAKQIKQLTTAPIVTTCSNCYELTPHKENLSDEQIKIIAETDGYIGITALGALISKATVESLVDHIDYLKKLIGIRHIALGFNFTNYLDKANTYLDDCPDVTYAVNIIDELFKRNYSSSEIEAIASINAKRVINKILKD